MSSINDHESPLIHASQNILYEGSADKGGGGGGGGDFTNSLPVLRPAYPPLEIAPELMSQGLAQRNPLQIMPSAGVMVHSGALLQPSVDDYIKTADEMSPYLTWGIPEMPNWMNLSDQMPLG